MQYVKKTSIRRGGFSLGEMVVTLVIAAMILSAVLSIYGRAERSAAAVVDKLHGPRLPAEVLQLIAQDLDRSISYGSDTRVTIEPGLDHGLAKARMTIKTTIRNSKDEELTMEQIVWQAAYDYDSPAPQLVLYRSYTGLGAEDKLLDSQRADWEKGYSFVPICGGLTVFRVEVPRDDNLLDRWSSTTLPNGVKVTLSFAAPFETVTGVLDVAEHEKISRTIAINRAREVRFQMPAPVNVPGQADANDVVAPIQPELPK